VIEGRFVLISSNKGYEFDAFLETFAVGTERGASIELFGLLAEGRILARIADGDPVNDESLLMDLNDRSGKLRFVKRAVACSIVGKTADLSDICAMMNATIKGQGGSRSVAVRTEGIGFSDPRRDQAIAKITDGIQRIDLRRPQVIAFLHVSGDFCVAGVTGLSSVLGVEDR